MNTILLIEDDKAITLLFSEFLGDEPYDLQHVDTGYEALDYIKRNAPDIILLDLNLPDMNGLDLIQQIRGLSKNCEIIVVTGDASAQVATRAVRAGARDYLVKPIGKERLVITIQNAMEHVTLKQKVNRLSTDDSAKGFYNFIGTSPVMRDLYKDINIVASGYDHVLIEGEPGSGKTLCVQTILDLDDSPQNKRHLYKPLEENLEDAIEQARGHTLIVEHINELSSGNQGVLLNALNTMSDIRLICTSSKPLQDTVDAGEFRDDLYYRINGLILEIPPLRRHGDDIVLLAQYYLERYTQEADKSFSRFDEACLSSLKEYHWPGNVRQLQNVIKNMVTMNADGDVITASMLPKNIPVIDHQAANENGSKIDRIKVDLFNGSDIIPVRDLEAMAIEHALKVCEGNVQEAAVRLKISPATLYRKKPAG